MAFNRKEAVFKESIQLFHNRGTIRNRSVSAYFIASLYLLVQTVVKNRRKKLQPFDLLFYAIKKTGIFTFLFVKRSSKAIVSFIQLL